jgi:hypothetical protein
LVGMLSRVQCIRCNDDAQQAKMLMSKGKLLFFPVVLTTSLDPVLLPLMEGITSNCELNHISHLPQDQAAYESVKF